MKLETLLEGLPPARRIEDCRRIFRSGLERTGSRLVVVDDDPTGTQTVHGVRVYMDWSLETLTKALSAPEPVFYVSTNSRGLADAEMYEMTKELGRNLRAAQAKTGTKLLFSSRSDSTLRGHFPREIGALLEGYGRGVDGVILAPAFFEVGRYTIGDVHWVDQGGELVSACETEFAKDPAFGYASRDMRSWVEEKTRGAWKAEQVLSLSLEAVRDPSGKAALDLLEKARGGVPIVLNAACYEDIEAAVAAIVEAERLGKTFAYRSAACFVKVRGGFEDVPLLGPADAAAVGGGKGPGLVAVGSYVGKTTRQLEKLLASGRAEAIELRVGEIGDPGRRESEKARVVRLADEALSSGRTAVLHTSREVRKAEGEDFLAFGNLVMKTLCEAVRTVRVRPAFLVAKGGITGIEIAKTGLNVKEAFVEGQIAKGVPLWRLGPESKWPGLAYVVFPGNVGTDETLREAVDFFGTAEG